ncbi:MAG: hypothetical protein GAK30_02831 [Paracidovorax wautersii]|uniref:Uncharacterized protein n=1 Tax=Paracidovorax wautersii TaxID=1177982 RepID=A0A7V8FMB7_9BURK|nr:MAG: hypothetical protein GAK30_02831 [Paracidovorax wautersii]
MEFEVCNCTDAEYERIARPAWARLIWGQRRCFRCAACGARMLVAPRKIEEAVWRQRQARTEFLTAPLQARGEL